MLRLLREQASTKKMGHLDSGGTPLKHGPRLWGTLPSRSAKLDSRRRDGLPDIGAELAVDPVAKATLLEAWQYLDVGISLFTQNSPTGYLWEAIYAIPGTHRRMSPLFHPDRRNGGKEEETNSIRSNTATGPVNALKN